MKHRCAWVGASELEVQYHDEEWGTPVHDDRLLFEMLTLEGAQSGLSWNTILNKRAAYQKAFKQFDAKQVAKFTPDQVDELMENAGLVRHRQKLESVVHNANVFLEIQKKWGSFDAYIWAFSHNEVIQNHWKSVDQVPSQTPISNLMSKDMKKCGFKFIGPTVCYAYMQGIGMVNDHTIDCYRYADLS